jgi:hypothetical protein
MKNLKTMSNLEKEGYKGTKVMSMIKAIESQEIFKHLRLVQQDEFAKVKNRYYKNGYLTKPYFSYLWNLYWNFVLNDFRFDFDKTWTIVTKHKEIKPEHIGMRILKSLENEKKN